MNLVEEIIKLQLRKPKNWNWELSTSKSSPHIAFPVIQLYNNRGKLILETGDREEEISGESRRSWHSSDVANSGKNGRNKLQRCRSDNVAFLRAHRNLSSIKEGEQAIQNKQHRRVQSDVASPAVNFSAATHPRYKTRTSSAGTLIIPEEDGLHNEGRRPRRRRPRDAEKYVTDTLIENRRAKENGIGDGSLFYSKSDIFPFGKSFNNNASGDKNINNAAGTQEVGKEKRKVLRSRRERSADNDKRICQRRGRETQSKECDLLSLVKRLSSSVADSHAETALKMGANVSRHSSKGLSGRRSQSSGSICKSKPNEGGGKMCGSSPGYLEERNNPDNNNQQEKGGPLHEPQMRIPPLGNGAPLHWKFSDTQTVFCDQGYGSERSPEEEFPPVLLPQGANEHCYQHLEPHACYPFITPESTFLVKLSKSSRGLGLSVTGGLDSGGSWPGLIRIKRLFPHQPASTCGLLSVGDLILEANGVSLTGLTNYEALEVLRTAPNQVDLKLCRPPLDVLTCVSPISEVPPPPPRRLAPTHLDLNGTFTVPEDEFYHGEFEVTLNKVQGSLGFTLRKEDDSALGHYVRALVREPALTDGRLKPGDKILSVNDTDISSMTHEQAVQYLRQCGDCVTLRLYRDCAQTPVAALSPTETTPRASFSKHLRQEAVDMLHDIAVRKSPARKLRRNTNDSDQFHEALLNYPDLDLFVEDRDSECCDDEDDERPSRPSSLDLYNPNQTPVAARKPRFNFTLAHNAYELNNLDADVLDAPNLTYTMEQGDIAASAADGEYGADVQEPTSMPHLPLEHDRNFAHNNPVYLSAHQPLKSVEHGTMKKWKGVAGFEHDRGTHPEKIIKDEYEVLPIELNRGWNSRLGFSLQGAAGVTYVSAVHSDSVAARDGRIRPGDRVIKVNDESVEHLSTNEIIELLRIVRGPVCIVVSRLKTNKEDCQNRSNAEN